MSCAWEEQASFTSILGLSVLPLDVVKDVFLTVHWQRLSSNSYEYREKKLTHKPVLEFGYEGAGKTAVWGSISEEKENGNQATKK